MLNELFNNGQNTAEDPHLLDPGTLQTAVGAWYKPGDKQRVHKQRGRAEFADTGSAAKVKGVKVVQYDDGTSKVLALSGTVLYSATAGATGTFASIKTGLSSASLRFSAAHAANRWYCCTDGADRVFVVESDGTVYDAGMQPQTVAPTTAAATGTGSIIRPDAPSGDMTSGANSMDGDLNTFGVLAAATASTKTATWTDGAWTGAAATRQLIVKWALQSLPIFDSDRPPGQSVGDSGASVDMGANVTVKFEMDTTAGTYVTLLNATFTNFQTVQVFTKELGSIDPDDCSFRATLTYNSGLTTVALRIYDVRMQQGSATTAFTTTTGFYYAIREYDQIRAEGSPIKAASILTTLLSQNQITVTRPSIVNSRTTHWEVYRTSDGGSAPVDLGRIAIVPIADSTYIDDFRDFASTISPPLKYPMLNIEDPTGNAGTLRIDRDQPPPQLTRIFGFKHSLVGVRGRALYYALAGLPGSWPEVYQISNLDMAENEELLSGEDMGEYCLLGSSVGLLRIQTLPRVAIGNFAYSSPERIAGAPGVVGPYAMCSFSIGGEPRVAWVSPNGVCVTNGYTWQRISDPWVWSDYEGFDKSSWCIHYDSERYILIVGYSTTSGGANNRYALLHIHPDHQGKLVFDQYGSYNDLASGQVSGSRRLYSAHSSDGSVYLEDTGTTDASNSYDSSSTWPLILTTRRMHGGTQDWSALKCWLRHSDFGDGQTASVAWTTGRDEGDSGAGRTKTRTQTVSLEGAKRTMFDIARSGEWHEVEITHTGAATGSLGELAVETTGQGEQGTVKVA